MRLNWRRGGQRSIEKIQQVEVSECGLACLAMIGNYHGLSCDLRGLRQRFSTSLRGMDLVQLMQVSSRMGLEARPVRVELDGLGGVSMPCVLHWNMNHFVVLERIKGERAYIHDPAGTARWYSVDEVSSSFTGVAIQFRPTNELGRDVPAAAPLTLKQLFGKITGLGRTLTGVVLVSLLLQCFLMLAPLFTQLMLDTVVVTADFSLLFTLTIAFLCLALLQAVVGFSRTWLLAYLSASVSLQWTGSVISHLLRLPVSYFETRSLGDVISRIQATRTIQSALNGGLVEVVMNGVFAMFIAALMLIYSPLLASICAVSLVFYLGLRVWSAFRLRVLAGDQVIAAARQQSHLMETIRGIQAIKIANREFIRQAGQVDLITAAVNRDFSSARLNNWIANGNQVIFSFERICVVALGVSLIVSGKLTVGMLVAYIAYKEQFTNKMIALIDKGAELVVLRVHADRLADIVLTVPEKLDGPLPSGVLEGSAPRFDVDVSFRYSDGSPLVLDGCAFRVDPGECVAIVGATGTGKSTLVKILLGVLEPTRGSVRVGGNDIRDLGMENYRSVIGAVIQGDELFAGTIQENIAFFEPDVDPARVREAASRAHVLADIEAMPMQFNTLVGDMGSSLSGGQKQRILIARALYRKPAILILDEATSHLDVPTEQRIARSVAEMSITRIVVAHRPDTIAGADRVIQLHRGRVRGECEPSAWLRGERLDDPLVVQD